jgi:hypothetical protein
MFLRLLSAFLLALFLMRPFQALAQSEEERRDAFYKQQEQNKEYEREREAGLKEYLKEQAEWEEQRKKDRAADKSRKKQESPIEDGPEYKADRKQKFEAYEDYESNRKAFLKDKKSLEAKNAKEQAKREAWALEEYGLDKERPRFDIAKRNMFGGKPGGSTPSFGGSGNFGGAPNFPPPPAFDDDGGYVPPPFPPSEPFEQPDNFPPPPSMPMPGQEPMGGDFDSGYFPPPPPPVQMGDDGF